MKDEGATAPSLTSPDTNAAPATHVPASSRTERLGSILEVAKAMTLARDLDSLLALILEEAKRVVQADRCTIFILDEQRKVLWSRIAQGLMTQEIRLPVGKGIAGWVAENNEVLNIAEAYEDERFNRATDEATGYRTQSILCVPMRGAGGELVGCVQALNRACGSPFSDEDEELLLALSGQAAAAIQNTLLHESIERLFDRFVKASVVAIESRDPTTSGHSERVAALTCELAKAVHTTGKGPYASVKFTPREMKELRYAGLLHDFGKVVVREQVLVKGSKLLDHQMEALRLRFELLRASIEREHYKTIAMLMTEGAHPDLEAAREDLERRIDEVDEMWAFIRSCATPAVVERGGFERLQEIARIDLPGAFDRTALLTAEEVEALSIPRGSLSAEERAEIESHVSHTFRFLSQIPWTAELNRVPEIAYAHHEKLNGRGYPRGLTADEIPLGAQMMAVADIYDALTASDRPYKKAITHEQAVDILQSDAARNALEPELVRIFVDMDVPGRVLGPRGMPAIDLPPGHHPRRKPR